MITTSTVNGLVAVAMMVMMLLSMTTTVPGLASALSSSSSWSPRRSRTTAAAAPLLLTTGSMMWQVVRGDVDVRETGTLHDVTTATTIKFEREDEEAKEEGELIHPEQQDPSTPTGEVEEDEEDGVGQEEEEEHGEDEDEGEPEQHEELHREIESEPVSASTSSPSSSSSESSSSTSSTTSTLNLEEKQDCSLYITQIEELRTTQLHVQQQCRDDSQTQLQQVQHEYETVLNDTKREQRLEQELCQRQISELQQLHQTQTTQVQHQHDKSSKVWKERIRDLQLRLESVEQQVQRTKQELFDTRQDNHRLSTLVQELQDSWWNIPELLRRIQTVIQRQALWIQQHIQRAYRIVLPYWTVVQQLIITVCQAIGHAYYETWLPIWRETIVPFLNKVQQRIVQVSSVIWRVTQSYVTKIGTWMRQTFAQLYAATLPQRLRLQLAMEPYMHQLEVTWTAFGTWIATHWEVFTTQWSVAQSKLLQLPAGKAIVRGEKSCRARLYLWSDGLLRWLTTQQAPKSVIKVAQHVTTSLKPAQDGGLAVGWTILLATLLVMVVVPRLLRRVTRRHRRRRDNRPNPIQDHPRQVVTNGNNSNGITHLKANVPRHPRHPQ